MSDTFIYVYSAQSRQGDPFPSQPDWYEVIDETCETVDCQSNLDNIFVRRDSRVRNEDH